MKERGFSLAEMLLTLMLVLFVVGVLGELVWDYSRAVRQSKGKELTFAALQMAAERVQSEVRAALPGTLNPGVGFLQFDRIHPSDVARLPANPPQADPQLLAPPFPPLWDPRPAGTLLHVNYSYDPATLSLARNGVLLASSIAGFSTAGVAGQGIQISLSIQENRKVSSFIIYAAVGIQ